MLRLICIPLVLAVITNVASASYVINLGGAETTGSGGATLANNAVVLSFANNGANTVRLTMTVPGEAYKIKDIAFNSEVAISSLSYISGVQATSASYSSNGISLPPYQGFDVGFSFSNSGPTGAFFKGQTSVYDLVGTGLTENDFNSLTAAGIRAAMKVNLPNNTSPSGKYTDPEGTEPVVPEPATLVVWSMLAAIGGVVTVWRRKTIAA